MKKDSNVEAGCVDWCERKDRVAIPLVKWGLTLWLLAVAAGCQTHAPQAGVVKEQTSTPPAVIVLREGDLLKISFPGSPTLDTTQQIRRDGKITLPLVGEVQAAGTTTEALQQDLVKLYAPQLSSKEVLVTLTSSSFPVFVTGSVIRPGKIVSDHPITALDAIMEAGGVDYTKANLKAVRVLRHNGDRVENYTLNLKLILEGKDSKPFYLQPSDIVFVPERLT
ncbi:MAG: polysaccharide biosynthesis/export family protein, partial [Verrucomicrobiia bacterium]